MMDIHQSRISCAKNQTKLSDASIRNHFWLLGNRTKPSLWRNSFSGSNSNRISGKSNKDKMNCDKMNCIISEGIAVSAALI